MRITTDRIAAGACNTLALMHTDPLANPFWAALSSLHRDVALGTDAVMRYPADVAPFLGVPRSDASAGMADGDGAGDVSLAETIAALVPRGDTALVLGVPPRALPTGWRLQSLETLLQMACTDVLPVADGPHIVALGPERRDDVLALTALVYPHYFRRRTMALGRYFGIDLPGADGQPRLAAMIGERLGAPGWREISAICTHPDFLGRGLARRLTAWLGNDILARGDVPFLHVSPANTRASGLYEAMGYRVQRALGFWSLQHADL